MGLKHIRKMFGVPAKLGDQVEANGRKRGEVAGSDGNRIIVKMGDGSLERFHPRKIRYLGNGAGGKYKATE